MRNFLGVCVMDLLTQTIVTGFWTLVLKGAEAATGKYIERRLDAKGAIDLSGGEPLGVQVSVNLRIRGNPIIEPYWILLGLKPGEGPGLTVPLPYGRPSQLKVPFQISGYDVFALFLDAPKSVRDRPTIRAAVLQEHFFHVGDGGRYHRTVQALTAGQAVELQGRISEKSLPFSLPLSLTSGSPASPSLGKQAIPGSGRVTPVNRGDQADAAEPRHGRPARERTARVIPNEITTGTEEPTPQEHDLEAFPDLEELTFPTLSRRRRDRREDGSSRKRKDVMGNSSRGCLAEKTNGAKCSGTTSSGYLLCRMHMTQLANGTIVKEYDSDYFFSRS